MTIYNFSIKGKFVEYDSIYPGDIFIRFCETFTVIARGEFIYFLRCDGVSVNVNTAHDRLSIGPYEMIDQ